MPPTTLAQGAEIVAEIVADWLQAASCWHGMADQTRLTCATALTKLSPLQRHHPLSVIGYLLGFKTLGAGVSSASREDRIARKHAL